MLRIRGLLVFVLAVMLAAHAGAGERVALVIGNAAYRHVAPLENPANDAADVSAVLRRLGFEVVEGKDLDRSGMERIVREFSAKLEGSAVAVFYYAGHGLQVNGRNHLAPIDARLLSDADLDFETVPLRLILRQMEREKRTNLVFLDACRDNPLATNLARGMGTRSGAVGRGLARVDTGVGTLIAFATQPGNVALDGAGRNSPFTRAILAHIEAPGKPISEIMIAVRNDVLRASNGKQVPWEHSSLTGQFYFKPPPAHGAAGKPERPAPSPRGGQGRDGKAVELAYWNGARESNTIAAFESYLEKFPDGTFAPLARIKIKELKGTRAAARPPEPQPAPAPPAAKPPSPSLHACDRMAAVPFDPRAVGSGLRTLRRLMKPKAKEPAEIAAAAVDACRAAVRRHPDTPRFKYQLGVALWLKDGDAAGSEVFGLVSRLARQGYPAAMLTMADAFRKQAGGANRRKARQWIRKAIAAYRVEANAGNRAAMNGLAMIFSGEYANAGIQRQPKRAMAWLRRSVEHGSPLGTFLMLGAFAGEFKVLQAPKLAFVWLRNLASQGNAQAMFATGFLRLAGQGVSQDVVRALDWLDRAANKGSYAAGLILAAVRGKTGNAESVATAAGQVLQAFRAQTPFVLMLTDDESFKLSERTWSEVQRRLAAAGHYGGTADGVFGPATKRALFAFATAP